MVLAGSFGCMFSCNSINNASLGVEVPKLMRRGPRKILSSSGIFVLESNRGTFPEF